MTRTTELDPVVIESKKKMISGTYLRNAWYVAAWSDDLADGQLIGRTILNEPVVLYRRQTGASPRCRTVARTASRRCIWARSFVATACSALIMGSSSTLPAPVSSIRMGPRTFLRARACAAIPVTEKHKAIWIWMGERPADPAKVPDFSVLDNVPELHTTKRDRITIRANYELIIDNLLDLSHTSYLHEGILGNAETVESEITVEQDGEDVVVARHAGNATAPGLFATLMPSTPERVDKFTRMRWMAPSNLRLVTGICMPGAKPRQRDRLSRHPYAYARERCDHPLFLHRSPV